MLPFAITGQLFGPLRQQIEAERESAGSEAIKENAAFLAKRIVRVMVMKSRNPGFPPARRRYSLFLCSGRIFLGELNHGRPTVYIQ
jgi:hypothetical protein